MNNTPRKIIVIAGVPGSGKTWVATQIPTIFPHITYLSHDKHFRDHLGAIKALQSNHIITESHINISKLLLDLKSAGFGVKAYFIIETPEVVRSRYEAREGRSIPKQHLGRIDTMRSRAREYGAFTGTSYQVLNGLIADLRNAPEGV